MLYLDETSQKRSIAALFILVYPNNNIKLNQSKNKKKTLKGRIKHTHEHKIYTQKYKEYTQDHKKHTQEQKNTSDQKMIHI